MKKITKILLIISIVLLIIGIICSLSVTSELGYRPNSEGMYIDGTDFAPLMNAFGSLFIFIIGLFAVLPFIATIATIWIIYGIILFIKWIIKKFGK